MHILLTGASGRLGSYVLTTLLPSHRITALDLSPLPPHLLPLPPTASFHILHLSNHLALESLIRAAQPPIDAVIHLGAIPDPEGRDPRVVHNENVVGSYNVLRTAADLGIKRIVQASSVNAIGLSYTIPEHRWFHEFPIDETAPCKPEDPYALSKQICELQAAATHRHNPTTRIASLRFHMIRPTYLSSVPSVDPRDLFAWVSYKSCADACLKGLTSEGWEGSEVFIIAAPEICWEGGVSETTRWKVPEGVVMDIGPHGRVEEGREQKGEGKVTAMQLMEEYWPGTRLREGWWGEGRERRGFWDVGKAERMLGWVHEG